MLKRGVIYARVSSKEQEKEGFSIPAQLKLLREYAVKNDMTVVREFADAETAKTAGREQFEAMLTFLRQTGTTIILVEKTDRLYRNFRDYVTIDDIEAVEIHLVKEGEILSKDSKSHQKFIHGIKVLMAKNYIDNLSEEVKKGLYEKAERGEYPGQAPIGYLNVVTVDKRHILGLDAERAPLVHKLFELYATGNHSLESLHAWSRDNGLRSRRGVPLARSYHEHLLKNPVYHGEFIYSGRRYQGNHDPLVSKSLWDAAQRAFRKHDKPVTRHTHNFLFSGLMTCADCGCAIVAERKKGKYVYYHCSRVKKECPSRAVYVREEKVADEFANIIQTVRVPEEVIGQVVQALKESYADKNRFRDTAIDRLRGQSDTLQKRLDNAYIDKLDGRITEAMWRSLSNQWLAEKTALEHQLLAYSKADVPYYESGAKILELAKHAHALYLRGTNEEKRQLLQLVVSNSHLRSGTLEYSLRKPFNWMAEWASRPLLLGD